MRHTIIAAVAASLLVGMATAATGQDTTRVRGSGLRITKEGPTATSGEVVMTPWTLTPEKFRADLEPIAVPSGCASRIDVAEVSKVAIKSDLYQPGMITPDSAKFLALCVIPGQIGSGEMHVQDGRTMYEISLIPERRSTNAKVIIDANTGEVLSSKTYGGLRGLAGYLRENIERKENKSKSPF